MNTKNSNGIILSSLFIISSHFTSHFSFDLCVHFQYIPFYIVAAIMISKLSLFLCLLLFHLNVSLNLNPLTPLHKSEANDAEAPAAEQKEKAAEFNTQQGEKEVKSPILTMKGEKEKTGEKASNHVGTDAVDKKAIHHEQKQKTNTKIKYAKDKGTSNPAESELGKTTPDSKPGIVQDSTSVLNHLVEEKDTSEGSPVPHVVHAKEKKAAHHPAAEEVDNTAIAQPELRIRSHKKCQSKEDKGCCEGFIDLVSDSFPVCEP